MTKIRKVLAALLALLMIFSSFTALAYAADETAGGTTVTFATKFFKQADDGSWAEITRAKPGDTVKARVYLGTDYFSNSSNLLFFYDKDFFTHSYSEWSDLEVNSESNFVKANSVSGHVATGSSHLSDLEADGYLDSGFLASHDAFSVMLLVGTDKNVKYSSDEWLFEFTLKVADNATGEGDLFVVENTVRSSNRESAYIDVPRGGADGTSVDIKSMIEWTPTVSVSSQPISVQSSLTFVTEGATKVEGETSFDGVIGTAITAPVVSRDGYTFAGWTDADGKVVSAPTEIPVDDLVLTASWVKNVTVTFDTAGGSEIDPAPYTDKTPGTTLTAPANPTRNGYTFLGWIDANGEEAIIPDEFPTSDVTFTAKWALNVTMSFVVDGDTVQTFDGYAGQAFDASQVNAPSKTGFYFTGWSKEVPSVFPEATTEYVAQWETRTYEVRYYVDGKYATSARVPYNAEIPTNVPGTEAPDGYALTGWYTDAECNNAFAEGTLMGTEAIKLYTKTAIQSYTSTFNAAGGKFANGETEVTVDTEYGKQIVAPEAPTLEGYDFAGWSPDVGIMNAAGGKTFYATWVIKEYVVKYYKDGEPYASFDITYGNGVDVPADPDKEGHTFLGWATSADSTETVDPSTYVMGESGYSFYAVFAANTYDAVFYKTDEDMANGVVYETVPTVYGEKIEAPAAPERDGYTFDGWKPEVGVMQEGGLEFTATWKAKVYTISFDSKGGTKIESITQEYGSSVTQPEEVPTKEGHTFDGWYAVGSDVKFEFTTMPLNGAKLEAHWITNEYEISFASNGGTPVASIKEKFGTAITAPAAPTRTGYNFVGWYEADAQEAYVFGTMPARSFELSAKWEAKTFEPGVKFNANGGQFGDGATDKYVAATFNEAINTPESNPERSGYDFLGWSKNSSATEASELGTLTQEISEESTIVFYAVWKAETYVDGIVFDADGGAFANGEAQSKVTATYGEKITAPEAPARDGYTFEGWASESGAQTGTTNLGKLEKDLDEETLVYYAAWKAITYTGGVKFDANTGAFASGVSFVTVSATFDQPIAKPDQEPVKEGHTFKGWAAASDATQALDSLGNLTEVIDSENPLTFYAVWEKETYIGKISFNANLGVFEDNTTVKTIDITFGDKIVAPGEPTRQGYNFKGWATAANALAGVTDLGMLETDLSDTSIEYYAVWEVADGVGYTVKVYIMNTEGVYGEPETHTSTGKTGDSVSSDNFYTLTDGLTLDSAYASENRTGTIAADGSTILEVHIKRLQYKFTVVVDDNSTSSDYYFGAIVAQPAAPSKTGSSFKGWDVTPPATMPANNVTIVAQWDAITYTVKYYVDGVQSGETENYNYGDAITLRTEPEKEGHTFSGWDKANTFPATMPAEDIVVSGYFTVDSHDAIFMANGEEYDRVSTEYGKKPVLSKDNPSKTGYIFTGWSPEITEMGTEDVTYTAQFTPDTVSYKVEIYTMDLSGVYGDPEEIPLTALSDTTATYPASAKEGFTIAGGSVLSGNVAPDGTLVLKVYYERNKYDFTIEIDGSETTESIYFGQTLTQPADPEKTGYSFKGWIDENKATYTFGTMPAKDVKVSALFTINQYTISFNVGEGATYVAPITQNYGTAVTAPDAPTKTGHDFGGWYLGDNETEYVFGTMPAESIILNAKWNVNQYTITFDLDNGSEDIVKTQDYGTVIERPAAPTKTGYTFKNWDRVIPATMPAESYTITALWEAETYTPGVKFDANGGVFGTDTVKYVTATFDKEIEAPEADPTNEGYTFLGWAASKDSKVALASLGKLTVDLDDTELTFYAVWAEADGVKYTVEVYTQNPDGTYTAATSVQYGKTGDSITVEGFYTVPEGFEHNAAHPDALESGVIAANGSTVLKVYIARKTYSATFEGVDEPVSALYGAEIIAPAAPEVTGSKFIKWIDDNGNEPTTMPVGGASYKAIYETSTYEVRYYVDNALVGSYRLEHGTVILHSCVGYTVPEGYTLSAWYTDKEMKNELAEGATVNAAAVSLYASTAPKTIDVVFDAGEGKFASGENTLTVPTVFGTQITAEEPTRDGYRFIGWNADLGILLTETPATYVAAWEAKEYKVTFVVGDDSEEFTFRTGEEIDIPADPDSDNQIFIGWYDADDNKLTEGTKMPAKDVTYTARFVDEEPEGATVTFYKYEASEHGPDGVEKPGFVFYSEQTEVKAGEAITLPDAPDTVNAAHYTFLGWFDADGNEYADGAKMPEGMTELALYPHYSRVTVKLVPVAGTTTVIERYTADKVAVKEQLADNSVTADRYTAPTTSGAADYSRWFIYGLPSRRLSANNIKGLKYFNVVGDGKVEITPVNGTGYGTGAVVSVYDCVTGEDVLVEQFYIVYFGDLDGDAKVTVTDSLLLNNELSSPSWSNPRRGTQYLIKAANLDGSSRVDVTDSLYLSDTLAGSKSINQVTGTVL